VDVEQVIRKPKTEVSLKLTTFSTSI